MEPLKRYTKSPEQREEMSGIVDRFRQLSHRKPIKPNELENHIFKAEQKMLPSFHEVIGPILTGFCLFDAISCGKYVNEFHFQSDSFSGTYP